MTEKKGFMGLTPARCVIDPLREIKDKINENEENIYQLKNDMKSLKSALLWFVVLMFLFIVGWHVGGVYLW